MQLKRAFLRKSTHILVRKHPFDSIKEIIAKEITSIPTEYSVLSISIETSTTEYSTSFTLATDVKTRADHDIQPKWIFCHSVHNEFKDMVPS